MNRLSCDTCGSALNSTDNPELWKCIHCGNLYERPIKQPDVLIVVQKEASRKIKTEEQKRRTEFDEKFTAGYFSFMGYILLAVVLMIGICFIVGQIKEIVAYMPHDLIWPKYVFIAFGPAMVITYVILLTQRKA